MQKIDIKRGERREIGGNPRRENKKLVRNSQALASLSTGRPAEDRFSVPNPSKIRKAELTELNTKTLTP